MDDGKHTNEHFVLYSQGYAGQQRNCPLYPFFINELVVNTVGICYHYLELSELCWVVFEVLL